jgi:hypothetical protein
VLQLSMNSFGTVCYFIVIQEHPESTKAMMTKVRQV